MAKGKKTGGRPKGVSNKRTALLSEIFTAAGLNVPERIIAILPTLDPIDQAKTLVGLMPYLHPKLSSVALTFDPKELSDSDLLREAEEALAHFKSQGKAK